MDIRVGDVLELKKEHPCGSARWQVLRVGMDFRLRCTGCGHELMLPRSKAEKSVKKIIRTEGAQELKNSGATASGTWCPTPRASSPGTANSLS